MCAFRGEAGLLHLPRPCLHRSARRALVLGLEWGLQSWLEHTSASSDFTLGLRGRPVKATPWAMATFPSMCFLLVCLKKKKKTFASFCSGPAETRGNHGELCENVCPRTIPAPQREKVGAGHTPHRLKFKNTNMITF